MSDKTCANCDLGLDSLGILRKVFTVFHPLRATVMAELGHHLLVVREPMDTLGDEDQITKPASVT